MRTLPFARLLWLSALLLTAPGARSQQLELKQGDTICLLGGATAERMQHDGWLELVLQARFSDLDLRVRNLGFAGDSLTVRQRTMNFGKFSEDGMEMTLPNEGYTVWDRYLDHCEADVVLALLGFNESFAGEEGLPQFERDLKDFIQHITQPADGGTPRRLALIGPVPLELEAGFRIESGAALDENLKRYEKAMRDMAMATNIPFVSLRKPLLEEYEKWSKPVTFNGVHPTSQLNSRIASFLDQELFGEWIPPLSSDRDDQELLAAIKDKNHLWFNRYRATDGYNVYGGRSRRVYAGHSNFDVLQRELDYLDEKANRYDEHIQRLARAEESKVDLSDLPQLIEVPTNKPGEGEDGAHFYRSAYESAETITAAPGMRAEVFADERQFPQLVNPVQMAWDAKGRLWVCCWATYPHWRPDQPMNDRILILEDTDGDGRADECTEFAGDLHNPTGIEFWNGGVFVGSAPDLLFLEDTDGDDRADKTTRVLHGLSSADTHHSANSFVIGQDGALYFQEGTFHMSQIETIHGPVRNTNGCVWRYEPRTHRVERYVPYNFANPHGHVFDRWGQDFVTDGTGNQNYYALPFSGYLPEPDKHRGYFTFFPQRSRPAGGTEILSSTHFPEENQGNYLIANVIGFRGIFQYRVTDDGSGFGAEEVDPLVQSTDLNFRPVDIEMGPDGAIYFLDWHNALIGHLQHHLRDPSRDDQHGRVYRVTYEGRELSEPAAIAGQPIAELLELLKSPEDRVRHRVRGELSARDSGEVTNAARAWADALDPDDPDHDHHLLEALWLHQSHERLDLELLERTLGAADPRARAAATRVLRYQRRRISDALDRLERMAGDEHPRVRLEAVVAASHFEEARAATVALEALRHPTDKFIDYALAETMRALEPCWQEALRSGEPIAAGNSAGIEYLLSRVDEEQLLNLPRIVPVLEAILTRPEVADAERLRAAEELSVLRGSSLSSELLLAVRRLDASSDLRSQATTRTLGKLLLEQGLEGDERVRMGLLTLVARAEHSGARAVGFAGLCALDDSEEDAWKIASLTSDRLVSFLEGLTLIEADRLSPSLVDKVRPLMFAAPPALLLEDQSATTGLQVSVFEPAPKNATLEHMRTLQPKTRIRAESVTCDLPEVASASTFGLLFEGALQIAESGKYTFFLSSDDGSRLYLDEACVIDNDGPHSYATKTAAVELSAGRHPLQLTFFESGGDQGLKLEWDGPGFDRSPLPSSVLYVEGGDSLRIAAIRAAARLPISPEQKLQDSLRLLGQPELLDATCDLIESVPKTEFPMERVPQVVETLAASLYGLALEERSRPDVVRALRLGKEIAGLLPRQERAAALESLEGLGTQTLLIRTLPHQMLFDLTEFEVAAGRPVTLVFQNNDVMPHNLVITVPGAMVRVGEAAELMASGNGAEKRSFVPDTDEVLWHSSLVLPGQTERISFTAPEAEGAYPFVCTYPGHWRVMNGTMRVTSQPSGNAVVTRRMSDEAPAAARSFVRDWTLDEISALLTSNWEDECSVERGAELFVEAGCVKCHTMDSQGSCAGPNLTAIAAKYRGVELLQHVLEPSLDVLEEFVFHVFELESGTRVIGAIVGEDEDRLHVMPALLAPEDVRIVEKSEITSRRATTLSPMPSGLLVTLEDEEILDLLAFLQSGADSAVPEDSPPKDAWLEFQGGEGPGAGQRIVLLSGDEEYRSEEALPMLASLLSEHHGFDCTVLFSQEKDTGVIRPDEQTHIPGMHRLEGADMLICFLRFRELPDDDMKHFVSYVDSGKPILGLRTATHAFSYSRNPNSPYAHYDWRSETWPGGFGRQVLGETWIRHHGHHGVESTRGILEAGSEEHPVLRGVSDVWGTTDVYGITELPKDAKVLLRGQVLRGMKPTDVAVEGLKNEPMVPIVWAREVQLEDGSTRRTVCSTIGSAVDCQSEDLRRLFINTCYWGVGLEVPMNADASLVVPYDPTEFGFGDYVEGVTVESLRKKYATR